MDDTQKNMPKQQESKAVWQPPVVEEYDASREIQGTLNLGSDLSLLQS